MRYSEFEKDDQCLDGIQEQKIVLSSFLIVD
jgi:hypothetical protein